MSGSSFPLLLEVDDATDLYADDKTKDAAYHFEVIQRNIEEVGPSNVVHVVTDCCSVMMSMWTMLQQTYPFLFITVVVSVAILTKNDVKLEKLKAKYKYIHFYDADVDDDHNSDVYRVVNIK